MWDRVSLSFQVKNVSGLRLKMIRVAQFNWKSLSASKVKAIQFSTVISVDIDSLVLLKSHELKIAETADDTFKKS